MTIAVVTSSKILVVDDEPLLQSLILQKFKDQIKSKEFEFSFASNGAEALKILDQNKDIGVLLIDIKMPVMDGLTLLKELVKQSKIYRPIIITAYGDFANIRRAMNGGASDFLTKPIDLDDLELTINRNIERFAVLKNVEKAHKELLELSKEIEVAQQIQQFLLPVDFSFYQKGARIEIYGQTSLTENMGGDFFDFFPLENDQLGFFVGEVADRGIPAALFMTMTRTLLHTLAVKDLSPEECFEKINKLLLVKEISFAIFVTAFYGIVNLKTGEVRYCNAGHWPALVISKEGELKEIGRYEGIPLAITEDPSSLQVRFEEKRFQFNPGDCLLLYTNGVIETQNASHDMFGETRIKEVLNKCSDQCAEDVVKAMQEELKKFSKSISQMNDVTLLAIRYNGDGDATTV